MNWLRKGERDVYSPGRTPATKDVVVNFSSFENKCVLTVIKG